MTELSWLHAAACSADSFCRPSQICSSWSIYYWHISSTYTPPLTERMYFQSRSYYPRTRATLVSVFDSDLPRLRPHRAHYIPPSHATAACVESPQLCIWAMGVLLSNSAYFSVCGCQTFTACAVRHLPIFDLVCVHYASSDTYLHLRFLRHFSTPALGGFWCFFQWPYSPPIRRITFADLGTDCPSVKSLHFPHLLQFEYWQVPSQHTCWFKFSTTSIRRFPVFVRQSKVFSYEPSNSLSCQLAHIIPALLWEISSSLQFVRSLILSLLLISRRTSFSEEFSSVFPFQRRSGSVPVTIQHGSVFIRNCLSSTLHLLYLRYSQ